MKFRNPFKKSAVPAKITQGNLFALIKGGCSTWVTPGLAYALYGDNSALSDAVDMISSKFADIQPVIVNDKDEVVENTEVIEFLKRPNPVDKWYEFAINMGVNFLLNNNSFLEVIGFINAKPIEIYNIPNNNVTVIEGSNEAFYNVTTTNFFLKLSGHFTVTHETGRIITPDKLKEIFHARGFNQQSSGLLAESKISSIIRDTKVLDQTLLHQISLLINGFSAGTLINLDTDDPEAYERFKQDVANQFSGAGNKGKVMVSMGNAISFEKIEQSNKDMETLELKRDSRGVIYQRYEIPKPLIESNAQTFDNYQTAKVALYDDAVLPLAKVLYAQLTDIFQTRKMLKPNERITFLEKSIPALQIRTNSQLKSLSESAILTRNELRAIPGFTEIGEEGDVILVPRTLMPIGSEPQPQPDVPTPDEKKDFFNKFKDAGMTNAEIADSWNVYKSFY